MSECEDAIGINTASNRFAVADGATEAFASQSWARQLAVHWTESDCEALTPEDFRSWVANEGQALHDSWSRLRFSWYAEEKARGGSFAAFVGVQINLEGFAPRWRAIALGDSCIIELKGRQIVQALPISESASFNATPQLVPSQSSMLDAAFQHVVLGSGMIESGTSLLLLSDAVAAWYLRLVENDDQVRRSFDKLLDEKQDSKLAELFAQERQRKRIRDDDIAIIKIDVEGSGYQN
jgi:Protein phosphatase 2C